LDIIEFRDYCLTKKGTKEEFPFDNKTLVFKVMGKVFALCNIDDFKSYNLKCDPEWAIELREEFNGIKPGFHMNKKHWNTVTVISDVVDKLAAKMIDHSYSEVAKGLKKADREKLLENV
jgi:predicted DNA-binding protein (MmcQ/YjbR family)